jgi:hypothetical protein
MFIRLCSTVGVECSSKRVKRTWQQQVKMMLIHLFFSHLPESSDYRLDKESRFAARQGLLCRTLDLASFDAEDSTSILQIGKLSEEVQFEECRKVYVSVSCLDIKHVFKAIRALCESLHLALMNSGDSLELILLEDLIYLERSYIYENKHNNFFDHFLKLSERYNSIVTQISSTNEVCNCWGEGDIHIIRIPEIIDKPEYYWEAILKQIRFREMFNQGNAVPRLISIQSLTHPFGKPLYRHPNDEEPPNIDMQMITCELKDLVNRYTGITSVNHVLIQYYRDGRDNIAAHSDKTLDIDLNTSIINLSIGSTREMFIQNKTSKCRFEKIVLRHGECVVFGLRSNRYWTHEIPKHMHIISHPIYKKGRISFTFRNIGTYYNSEHDMVFGQGSPCKKLEDASAAAACKEDNRMDLIKAFSKENRLAEEFCWKEVYGDGFFHH